MRCSMPPLPQSLLKRSPRHLCSVKVFREKNSQHWTRIESGFTSDNSTHANPCDQMGCIQGCWKRWLMSLKGYYHLWQVMEIWELEKGKYCSHLQKKPICQLWRTTGQSASLWCLGQKSRSKSSWNIILGTWRTNCLGRVSVDQV